VLLPDFNLFLYVVDETSSRHARARVWLNRALSGTEPVGSAWIVLIGFVRISTRAQIIGNPVPVEKAFAIVDGCLSQPNTLILHPTERHLTVLRGLAVPLGTAGSITSDAHLAALAIEHGGGVCSVDTDFARFPGLRWTTPLA
jgi:uncharacterized protein